MRVVSMALVLFTMGMTASAAQEIGAPGAGSFDEFVRRRAPGLTLPSLPSGADPVAGRRPTLLEAPKSPFPRPMERLPESDPRTLEHLKSITNFLERRQQLGHLLDQYRHAAATGARLRAFSAPERADGFRYVADKITKWNGDIFWAPASKESDTNLQFADEVRSVFGPIPPFDVTTLGTVSRPDGSVIETGALFVEVDGNRVELKPNTSKAGSPLEFEHRDAAGRIVKWSSTIDKCDKPSLAGGVTPCGTASRISRTVRGAVEWLALARKTRGVEPLGPLPYWSQEDPSYALLGYIGFNRVSGEVAFFDGGYDGVRFSWTKPIVPPGGKGYGDEQGRAVAAKTYDSTFRVNCAACHDNKEPRIITPYIKQARVGYRSPELAAAFSLKEILPELPRRPNAPYRVVGTSYAALHKDTIEAARTVNDPTRNCTACHGLTDQGTARFASDAAGRLGTLTGDPAIENNFRTAWAHRAGEGKIHPWMLPVPYGNDMAGEPPPPVTTDTDWEALRAVLEDARLDTRSLRVYTEAPAPESPASEATRIADPAGPQNFTIAVEGNRDDTAGPMAKEIRFAWTYLNTLGGVPERDDVRFHMAIREVSIPPDSAEPRLDEYPSIDETKGIGASLLGGGVHTDGRLIIVKDISFGGHTRWMDPVPAFAPRQYRVDFPAARDKRYLIRVVPKRFAFDQGGELFSNADHLFFVDVR